MLTITVPPIEGFDNASDEFVILEPAVVLTLEHSLVSVSKWEEVWEKPFLSDTTRTDEQAVDYIRQMVLTPDVPQEVLARLSQENHDAIGAYLGRKMTATWFTNRPGPRSREIITAEIIYYWMISLGVPMECQYWHLNKLLAQIRVVNEKNSPKKKMARSDATAQRHAMNEARKAQLGTSG